MAAVPTFRAGAPAAPCLPQLTTRLLDQLTSLLPAARPVRVRPLSHGAGCQLSREVKGVEDVPQCYGTMVNRPY